MDYNDFGRRAAEGFTLFATATAGQRALAASAGIPLGASGQSVRLVNLRRVFVGGLQEDMQTYLEGKIAYDGSLLAKRSAARFATASFDIFDITNQVTRDAQRQAKFGLLNPLDTLSARRGAGAIGLLAQRRLATPNLSVRDSSGRQWDGAALVRLITRDFAYQTFIDAQFQTAIAAGAKEVTINHSGDMNGKKIDLAGDWIKIRDSQFHINSEKTISYVTL